MGDPKKKRKQYETPRKTWDRGLLERERKLVNTYGLKNKREVRRNETWLRNKRKLARDLLALPLEIRIQRERELIGGLSKIGLVKAGGTLDDVLGLKAEELLEKRLQTVVFRKGLANSAKQARQFITHGHIAINGKKVSSPNYLVPLSETGSIAWFKEPVQFEVARKTSRKEKDIKQEFEEVIGIAEGKEDAAAASAQPAQNAAGEGAQAAKAAPSTPQAAALHAGKEGVN